MRIFVIFCLTLLVCGISTISSFHLKMNFFDQSLGVSTVTFLINKNEKIGSVSKRLKERNLIFSSQFFEYAARYKKLDKKIKYGEFDLTDNMSIIDILKKVTTNQALSYQVVIRNCMTNWEIIDLFKKKKFLINDLEGVKLNEGIFAPDTYTVGFNTKFTHLMQIMQDQQTKILNDVWSKRKKEAPVRDELELLILASIIEKEAATIAEMPVISSVFINRLNIGMRLQSDPTVSYGIDFGNIENRKTLTKNDLKVESTFNTYRNYGLPPSPICNPSRSAIAAALNPVDTNYLYFVLTKSGEHGFSETFEEHKSKVSLWRKSKNK
jgi:UPF0755 protein